MRVLCVLPFRVLYVLPLRVLRVLPLRVLCVLPFIVNIYIYIPVDVAWQGEIKILGMPRARSHGVACVPPRNHGACAVMMGGEIARTVTCQDWCLPPHHQVT